MPPLLIALIIVAVLLLAAIELGYIPPLNASTLIKIHNGTISLNRGQLPSSAVHHVGTILREAGVSAGYIAITSGTKVYFSRSIPELVHQQLRNVLLNQWR